MKATRKLLLCILCLAALATAVFGLASCGEEEAPECPHVWNVWETVTPSTCLEEGLERRTCKLDATHTEERAIDKLDHSFENYVSNNDATCAKDGTKTAYCETPGCTAKKNIEDVGSSKNIAHVYKNIVDAKYLFRDAYCGSGAVYYQSCESCKAINTEKTFVYGAPKHSYGTVFAYDKSFHWNECSLCEYEEVDKPVAHTWSDEKVISEANCTQGGEKLKTCVCGAVERVTTPPRHTLTFVAANPATCTTQGTIAYYVCSVNGCGKTFADEAGQNEITAEAIIDPVKPHSYTVWQFNEDSHWQKCQWCVAVTESEYHSEINGFDASYHFSCECQYDKVLHTISTKSTADGHWDECTQCSYHSDEVSHDNVYQHQGDKHWLSCTYCNYSGEKQSHVWSEALGFNDAGHFGVCSLCLAEDEVIPHTPATKHDDDNHWTGCTECEYQKDVTAHVWGDGTVTTEPDCLTDGVRTFICACGRPKTEAIPHHALETVLAAAPGCTTPGNIEYRRCTVCDNKIFASDSDTPLTLADIVIQAAGHNFVGGTVGFDEANHWINCTKCAEGKDTVAPHTLKYAFSADKHWHACDCGYKTADADHAWDNGTVTTEPGCLTAGEKTFACECGAKKTEPIEKTGHSLTKYTANAPTCVLDGNIEYYHCSGCGKYFSDENATAEISYASTVITKTGVHTQSGTYTFTATGHKEKCAKCDYYFDETGHSFTDLTEEFVSADCQTVGYKVHKCSLCNYKERYDEAPKTDCNTTLITTSPADCEGTGTGYYHCSVCLTDTPVTLPALGHNYDLQNPLYNEVVAPDCENDGYTKHICTREGCGEYYCDTVVPTEGHDWQAPTCTEAGYCKTCSIQNTSAPATGHDWQAPTCTEAGYCKTCEAPGEPQKGHKLVLDVGASTAASCTTTGKEVYVCENGCGHSEEITKDAQGHTVASWTKHDERLVAGASCEYEIINTGYCTVCGTDVYETADETVFHHSFAFDSISKIANCETVGKKLFVCQNGDCTESYTEDYTDATVHAEGCSHVIESVDSSEATITGGDKDAIKFNGNDTTIAFDDATKNQIAGAGDVSVSATTPDKNELDEEYRNALDESGKTFGAIVSLTMTGMSTNEFDGEVTVKVPYELNGSDPDDVTVAYIASTGIIYIQATYVEENGQGYAVFTTKHFSYYTVTNLTPGERCEEFGHLYEEKTVPATCLTSGYKLNICKRCGDKITVNELPALGHNWSVITDTPASCAAKGYKKTECTRCHISLEEITPALEHNWEYNTELSYSASCEAEGKDVYSCEGCGGSFERTLPKLSHSYSPVPEECVEASCKAAGKLVEACESCGSKRTTSIPKLPHAPTTETKTATCLNGGYVKTYCEVCGETISYSDETPVGDHSWNLAEASCDTDKLCTVCGTVSEKAIGHNMSQGVCLRCGEGCEHAWTSTPVRVEGATCASGGKDVYECTVCHLEEKRDNGQTAAEHSYKVLSVSEATCQSASYKTYVCEVCHHSYKESVAPALKHEFSEGVCIHCGISSDRFYLTMLESWNNANGLSIKLENLKFDMSEIVAGSTELKSLGTITGTEISELMLYIDENGEIQGALIASAKVKEGLKTSDITIKGVISDGTLYIAINGERGITGGAIYTTVAVDYVVDGITSNFVGGFMQNSDEILDWAESELLPIFKELIDANADEVNTAIGSLVDIFFSEEANEGGAKLVFDYEKLKALNTNLKDLKVSEFINLYFGENAYSALKEELSYVLNLKLSDLPAYVDSLGISSESVIKAINDVCKLMGAPKDFDVSAMLNDPDYASATLGMMAFMTDDFSKDLADVFSMLEGASLYTIIEGMTSGNVKADGVSSMVGGIISMLEESISISINTDEAGNITSYVIDVKNFSFETPVGIMTLDLTLTITPDGKFDVSWGGIADDYDSIVKLPPVPEIKDEVMEDEEWRGESYHDGIELDGQKLECLTMIFYKERYVFNALSGVVITNVRTDCSGWYEIHVSFKCYSERARIVVKAIMGDGMNPELLLISTDTRDDADYMRFYLDAASGNYVYTSEGKTITLTMEDVMSGDALASKVFGGTKWELEYESLDSYTYYYNPTTQEISEESIHDWVRDDAKSYPATDCGHDGLEVYYCSKCQLVEEIYYNDYEHNFVLNKELSYIPDDCEVTGKYVYECSVCKESQTRQYAKGHTHSTKYQLNANSSTCHDGVDMIFYCSDCGKEFTKNENFIRNHIAGGEWVLKGGEIAYESSCVVCGEADPKMNRRIKLDTTENIILVKSINEPEGSGSFTFGFIPTEDGVYDLFSLGINELYVHANEGFDLIEDIITDYYNFGIKFNAKAGELYTFTLKIGSFSESVSTISLKPERITTVDLSEYGSACGGTLTVTSYFGRDKASLDTNCTMEGEFCTTCGFYASFREGSDRDENCLEYNYASYYFAAEGAEPTEYPVYNYYTGNVFHEIYYDFGEYTPETYEKYGVTVTKTGGWNANVCSRCENTVSKNEYIHETANTDSGYFELRRENNNYSYDSQSDELVLTASSYDEYELVATEYGYTTRIITEYKSSGSIWNKTEYAYNAQNPCLVTITASSSSGTPNSKTEYRHTEMTKAVEGECGESFDAEGNRVVISASEIYCEKCLASIRKNKTITTTNANGVVIKSESILYLPYAVSETKYDYYESYRETASYGVLEHQGQYYTYPIASEAIKYKFDEKLLTSVVDSGERYEYEYKNNNFCKPSVSIYDVKTGKLIGNGANDFGSHVIDRLFVRYELVNPALGCEGGVNVYEYCIGCDYEQLQYTFHEHSINYDAPVTYNIKDFGAYCNGYITVRYCACKENFEFNNDYYFECDHSAHRYEDIDGGYKYTYVCAVSYPETCGFTYTYESWSAKDSFCRATNYERYVFGVGSANPLVLEKSYVSGGYQHSTAETNVDDSYEENGYTVTVTGTRKYCKDCEATISEAVTKNYSLNGQLEFSIYEKTTYNADGTKQQYNYRKYETKTFNGNRIENVIVLEKVEHYDKKGVLYDAYEQNYVYNGCVYDYTVTTTPMNGFPSSREVGHTKSDCVLLEYLNVPTCTQSGNASYCCPYCEYTATYELAAKQHNFVYYSEDSKYHCAYCELISNTGSNGNYVLEDLTAKYGSGVDLTVGYLQIGEYFASYIEVQLIAGDTSYNLFNSLDGNGYILDDGRMIKVSVAGLKEAIARVNSENGTSYTLCNSSIRVSIVPADGNYNHDYSITLDSHVPVVSANVIEGEYDLVCSHSYYCSECQATLKEEKSCRFFEPSGGSYTREGVTHYVNSQYCNDCGFKYTKDEYAVTNGDEVTTYIVYTYVNSSGDTVTKTYQN